MIITSRAFSAPVIRVVGGIVGAAAVMGCAFLMGWGTIWNAWIYAVIALALVYAISLLVSGKAAPFQLAVGADGLLSVSKFQFLAWNITVLCCYVWLAAIAYFNHPNWWYALVLPHNVLYVMGFSLVTLATAKGITVSYLNGGRISKPPAHDQSSRLAYLCASDDGVSPDLVKIQMLAWTVVAIVIFVARVIHSASPSDPTHAMAQIPDIDPALMVLMGLGQAAYLGNKLTGSDVPVITTVTPATLPLATGGTVTIAGSNVDGKLTLCIDDLPVGTASVPPHGTSASVAIPAATLNGAGITAGPHKISCTVDGVQSSNSLPLTITA